MGESCIYSSGNRTVDAMGQFNVSGNIIPATWFKTIVSEKGKPYLNAIVILSDIVYWYRPTEVRDEKTGEISYKKKFKADCLQLSYDEIGRRFGLSKGQAKDAVLILEQLGIIERDLREIDVNGMKLNNVMFLHLNYESLYEFTYPEIRGNVDDFPPMSENPYPSMEISTEGYGEKTQRGMGKIDRGVSKNRQTNTKNTTEITTIDYSINLSADGAMDGANADEYDVDNILFDIEDNNGIPYEYAFDKKKMETAIKGLVDWNSYSDGKYYSEDDQLHHDKIVQCIIEMATEKELREYSQCTVSYKHVIDALNQIIVRASGSLEGTLHFFVACVMDRYGEIIREKKLTNPRAYLKSVIWNKFESYKFDYNAFFEESYNNRMRQAN